MDLFTKLIIFLIIHFIVAHILGYFYAKTNNNDK